MNHYARQLLLPFSIAVYKDFKTGQHIGILAKKLEAVERGEIKRLLVMEPPRHCKSLLCSQLFPAWYLGRNPTRQIITATYGDQLARDFGRKVRNTFAQQEFKAIFPEVTLAEDSAAIGKFNTNKDGVYIATGVGGALTGRGADVLLIDDAIRGRQDADSPVIRNNVWEWYQAVARTRLMPGGAVVIIGTRWHTDDLIGRVLKLNAEGKGEKWEIVCLPALNDAGEPLWPEMWSKEELERTRQEIGEREWGCLYQQNPVLVENQEFKQEYFRYFEEADIEDKVLDVTITVDLATGDKEVKNGDDVGISVVGKERAKPDWYVLDMIGDKLDPMQVCDALFMYYAQYRPRKILIESNSYQRTFKFWLQEEMKKRNTYLPISLVSHSTKKEERIRGLIPAYKAGVIYHRKRYAKLERQLLNFPVADHDDMADALAMQLEAVRVTDYGDDNDIEKVVQEFINQVPGQVKPHPALGVPAKDYDERRAVREFING